MHEVIRTANNEDIYDVWICIVPDEPSDDDFQSIAEDDASYSEVWDLFLRLVKRTEMRY